MADSPVSQAAVVARRILTRQSAFATVHIADMDCARCVGELPRSVKGEKLGSSSVVGVIVRDTLRWNVISASMGFARLVEWLKVSRSKACTGFRYI